MKRSEKPLFVENLTAELKTSKTTILVDYAGLSVKLQQDLKKRLKAVGAKILIVKNTLFKLAGKEASVPEDVLSDTVLSGQTALVIGEDDPIAPLQVLAKFAQEFQVPQFKVGIVEGTFQDKDTLITLSTLPGKNVLFAQVTATVSSPINGLLGVLQGNLQKLVYVLNERVKGQS